jgi:hypothetical protein
MLRRGLGRGRSLGLGRRFNSGARRSLRDRPARRLDGGGSRGGLLDRRLGRKRGLPVDGRLRHRRRRLRLDRRQERQGVHVAVRIRSHPDAEVDMWVGREGVAAGAAHADQRPFLDEGSTEGDDLAELEQRDRPAVVRADGDRLASARHRPRERDRPRRGRTHGRAGLGADVRAAVLAGGIRIVCERERTKDRAGHRPAPAVRRRRDHERGRGREQDSAHLPTPRSVDFEQSSDGRAHKLALPGVATDLSQSRHEAVTESRRRACFSARR